MEKIDYKKELKHLYNPPQKEPVFIDVPPMNYLMVDGQGKPDSIEAQQAIQALYSVAYSLKFMIKKAMEVDYGVLPLEGLWWAEDMESFRAGDKNAWRWTYMIMQPDLINAEMVDTAVGEVKRKKRPAAIGKLRFESFDEGRSAQIMHIGSYADEGPNIEKLHTFIHNAGLTFDGKKQKHHEIYLSDPGRTAVEKLKTIVRQPAA
ncbi:hypothetical protein DGWBC_1370 [Dehalogenimonas sp. WBC-2]|nr:hypothetical protein DGWBC_1370 [Dehalogenimonas sp. WBC-2]